MNDQQKAKLEKILEEFSSETRLLFPEGSAETATITDLSELSRQVYYLFSELIKEL